MLKRNYRGVGLILIAAFTLTSCAQQPKSANSREAIEEAKTLQSTEEQVKYLVSQANAFINSDQFDEAIKTAKYVLSNLDEDSQQAKSIIEKAKTEIKAMTQREAEEMKAEIKRNLGKFADSY